MPPSQPVVLARTSSALGQTTFRSPGPMATAVQPGRGRKYVCAAAHSSQQCPHLHCMPAGKGDLPVKRLPAARSQRPAARLAPNSCTSQRSEMAPRLLACSGHAPTGAQHGASAKGAAWLADLSDTDPLPLLLRYDTQRELRAPAPTCLSHQGRASEGGRPGRRGRQARAQPHVPPRVQPRPAVPARRCVAKGARLCVREERDSSSPCECSRLGARVHDRSHIHASQRNPAKERVSHRPVV